MLKTKIQSGTKFSKAMLSGIDLVSSRVVLPLILLSTLVAAYIPITYIHPALISWLGLVVLLLCTVITISVCHWQRIQTSSLLQPNNFYLSIFVVVLVCISAVYWFSLAANNQRQAWLDSDLERVDQDMRIQIIEMPAHSSTSVRFKAKVLSHQPQNAQGERLDKPSLENSVIRLSCYRCKYEFAAQEIWQLRVRLKRPNGHASWQAFDYEKYLFHQQIVASGYIRKGDNHRVSGANGFSFEHYRGKIKAKLLELYKANSSALNDLKHQSGMAVMLALTIGDKRELENELNQALRASGLSHLMVISGLHIGLVFLLVKFLLTHLLSPFSRIYRLVPRPYIVLPAALMTSLVYAGLAGFAISTQRALVMIALYVAVRLFGLNASLLRILLITAVALVILEPLTVLDAGFWLSFWAVLIIAIYQAWHQSNNEQDQTPVLEPSSLSVKATQKLKELLIIQLCIALGMLPMMATVFGEFSLISIFMNLLFVPVYCFALIPVTLLSVLLYAMGLPFVDQLLLLLIQVFGSLNQFFVYIASNDLVMQSLAKPSVFTWLVVIAGFYLIYRCKLNKTSVLAVVLLIICLLLIKPLRLSESHLEQGDLDLVLFDVGQGLSLLISTQNSHLVYDTGPSYGSGFAPASAVVLPYLQSNGIDHLDYLIVSHGDKDHIGGFDALDKEVSYTNLYTSRVDLLPQASPCATGVRWQLDDVTFETLAPSELSPQGSNNRSCVIKVSTPLRSILLTGDIEKSTERYLVDNFREKLNADILLVPHQGSKTSSSNEFLDAVNPAWALVATGYLNHYGHPHPKVIERYKLRSVPVYDTAKSGSIKLKIRQNRVQIAEYRQQSKFWWRR